VIGAIIVISVVLAALTAPSFAPYPGHAGAFVDFRSRHLAPSLAHIMGTDNVGRDIFSRVLFGYRVSLLLVVGVLGVAMPLGVLFGLLAGYFAGLVETIVMGFTNVMLAMPPLVMALAITAVLSPDLVNSMIAITCLWWTWHCRLVYRVTKSVAAEDFVEAARIAGASHVHVLFRELLPNCTAAISVKTTLDAGFVILFGASLSFLGLGVQPPTPDLGTMVAAGAQFLPEMWWEAVMPGLAILYAMLGFNLLGDGLRDMMDVEIS
jgi:peptide/nickel transport system permease protein